MEDVNKEEKQNLFSQVSQDIKNIPVIKEYFEKFNSDNRIKCPEDMLIWAALGDEFCDLDEPSQNLLIKELSVRILKLESGI